MNEDTSGFYGYMWGDLYYAPNFVTGPGFNLERTIPEDRLRETNGWRWFDTEAEALAFHGLTPVEPEPEPEGEPEGDTEQ